MESDLYRWLAAQGAMIERLCADSRRCAPGVAFFAYPGETADGRRYIEQAIGRGASAVVWEDRRLRLERCVAGAQHRRQRPEDAGRIARQRVLRPPVRIAVDMRRHGHERQDFVLAMDRRTARRGGVKTGVIGTLGSGFPGALSAEDNTTPDALELHRRLAELRREGRAGRGDGSVFARSRAGRLNGVAFDCALLTNLSQDHLDYHGTLEAYAEAKSRLFDTPGLGVAVLNLDDVLGVRLAQRLAARGMRTIGYSLSEAAVAPGSVTEYIAAREIHVAEAGTDATLASSWGTVDARINQPGRFNVANALGVLGCLVAYGIPFTEAAARLGSLPAVPGRMQRLGGEGRPLVFVDYAHTPDALEKVLQALRPIADARGGRLIAVFGAGGDRDPSKRAPMGAAASRHADRVVLTSDNPRSEEPLAIIAAVRAGVTTSCAEEPDRAVAIESALRDARSADVVLLAGKGHESEQIIAGRKLPFSDVAVAPQRWRAGPVDDEPE
jgi:UDP-N-acetylmuramoyl-L-alanyl-D-glutamate--2,6-diaminopimelate ligase